VCVCACVCVCVCACALGNVACVTGMKEGDICV